MFSSGNKDAVAANFRTNITAITWMKIFLIFCMLVAAPFQLAAQAKPQLLKFDEFSEVSNDNYVFTDEVPVKERIARFVSRLKREHGKKVYIVYYRARIADYFNSSNARNVAERARFEVYYSTLIGEKVEVIDGGLREFNSWEFWIASRTASPPVPSPTFSASEAIDCPSLYVALDRPAFDSDKPVVFNAGAYPNLETSVEWRISSGTMLEGQGTNSLRVDPEGSRRITAIATFRNVPPPCKVSAQTTADVGLKPFLMDRFDRAPSSQIRALLDGFLTRIAEDDSLEGYVILYGGRSEKRSLEARVRLITEHFYFRRFPLQRITIRKGGYREYPSTELWLLPTGVEPPKPTPTVDSKFVRSYVPERADRKRK